MGINDWIGVVQFDAGVTLDRYSRSQNRLPLFAFENFSAHGLPAAFGIDFTQLDLVLRNLPGKALITRELLTVSLSDPKWGNIPARHLRQRNGEQQRLQIVRAH
jgi:hypothetical protein